MTYVKSAIELVKLKLRSNYHSLFMVLLFLFIISRVSLMLNANVWYDEMVSLKNMTMSVNEIIDISTKETNTPWYYLMLKMYGIAVSTHVEFLRAFSVVFSIATFIIVIRISKIVCSDKSNFAVITTALLLISSPFSMKHSIEIRVYPLVLMLASLSFLALCHLLYSNLTTSRNLWLLALLLTMYLLLLLHVSSIYWLLVCLVVLFGTILASIKQKREARYIKYIELASVLLLLLIPVVMLTYRVFNFPDFTVQLVNIINIKMSIISNNMGELSTKETAFTTFARIFWGEFTIYSVLLPTLALLLIGLINLFRTGRKVVVFAGVLCFISSLFISPRGTSSSRYLFFAFPLVIVGLSSGIDFVLSLIQNAYSSSHKLISKLLVGGLLTIIISILISVFLLSAKKLGQADCLQALSTYVYENSNNFTPNTLILINPGWKKDLYDYYSEREHGTVSVKGVNTIKDPNGIGLRYEENVYANWYPTAVPETVSNLSNYITGYKTVYYIDTYSYVDKNHLILNWLRTNLEYKERVNLSCSSNKYLLRFEIGHAQ